MSERIGFCRAWLQGCFSDRSILAKKFLWQPECSLVHFYLRRLLPTCADLSEKKNTTEGRIARLVLGSWGPGPWCRSWRKFLSRTCRFPCEGKKGGWVTIDSRLKQTRAVEWAVWAGRVELIMGTRAVVNPPVPGEPGHISLGAGPRAVPGHMGDPRGADGRDNIKLDNNPFNVPHQHLGGVPNSPGTDCQTVGIPELRVCNLVTCETHGVIYDKFGD